MKFTLTIIGFFLLMGLIGYGAWRLERAVHYKFAYESMVHNQIQTEVQPLEDRVKALEQEVQNLQTNRIK